VKLAIIDAAFEACLMRGQRAADRRSSVGMTSIVEKLR
jgi:hypothetical protein